MCLKYLLAATALAAVLHPVYSQVACTADWTPVCGDDNKVYSNSCNAGAAGVQVSYTIDSPPSDLAAGGWCPDEQPGGMCTMDWTPVCGENNKVYSNECEATAAYVETAYIIDSPPSDLAAGGWCPDNQPGGVCTADWTPVCGVNGKVYSNECGATAAYVETAYTIDSPPSDLAAGGWCPDEQPGGVCTADWTPVCGVNGEVYSNECGATAAYVESAYTIDSPPSDLAAGGWCPDEQPGGMCTADWTPVCGSDGEVYSNECGATAAYVKSSLIASPADDLAAGDDCEYTETEATTLNSGAMPPFGTSVVVLVMSLLVVLV